MTSRSWRLWTAGAALLLALGQGRETLLYHDAPYLCVLLLVAAAIGGGSAVALLWRSSFGTRLTLGLLAGTALAGHILILVMGVPGSAVHGTAAVTVLVMAAALLSLVLVALTGQFPDAPGPGLAGSWHRQR